MTAPAGAPGTVVVVGASLAGLRAAQTLRKQGHDGELVVVGAEPEMPYTRPPLSKELLGSEKGADEVALPLMGCEADWRLGVAASALDTGHKRLTLADGETLAYDALVIATGARPRPWPGEGLELGGIHMLRDVGDALELRRELTSGSPKVAIVGAGFIGCEVAATARKLGLDVTLVDIAPHPMTALGAELGERCAALHRDRGVELRLGVGVEGFASGADGRVAAVELADGTRVDADVVVIALGALPNTEWLTGSGLQLQPGVRCDATLAALGAEGVWAAGDAATWPHPLADGEDIRIEHWTNAAEQGVHVAKNILGEPTPYAAVPYFWSDQYDVKIQAVGLASRAERVEVLEADDEGRFVAVGSRAGTVVFACAFGAPRRLMPYRKALADQPALHDLRAAIQADPKRLRGGAGDERNEAGGE